MPQFIKYTRSTGSGTQLVFVNVACLSAATYDQQSGEIAIVVTDGTRERLTGQAATDALAILNKLASL